MVRGTHQYRLNDPVTSGWTCVTLNAKLLWSWNIADYKLKVDRIELQDNVNQWKRWNNTEEQRRNGEKGGAFLWSCRKNDYCTGFESTRWQSASDGCLKLLSLWSFLPASMQIAYKMPPPLLNRVLTTSALGGAKVDMSTIHTNYKRLSECQTIFRRYARPSTKKIGF